MFPRESISWIIVGVCIWNDGSIGSGGVGVCVISKVRAALRSED